MTVLRAIRSLQDAETNQQASDALDDLLHIGRGGIEAALGQLSGADVPGLSEGELSGTDAEELMAWGAAMRDVLTAIKSSGLGVQPFGLLYLERLDFVPQGVTRGEFLNSVAVAPGEISYVTHKVWATTTTEFENIVTDSFEDYSEKGVSEKSDISQSTENQSSHQVNRDVSLQADAKFQVVTVAGKAGFAVNDTATTGARDSIQHSMDLTRKASSRSKKERKVSIKVTTVQGTSSETGQRFYNPDPINPLRVDYYELLQNWEIDLVRFGARLAYDLVLPAPGAELLRQHVEATILQAELAKTFVFPFAPSEIDAQKADELGQKFGAAVPPPPAAVQYRYAPFTLPANHDTSVVTFDIPYPDGYVVDGTPPPLDQNGNPDWNHMPQASHVAFQGASYPGETAYIHLLGGSDAASTDSGALSLTFLDGVTPTDGKITIVVVYAQYSTMGGTAIVRFRLADGAYQQWQAQAWGALRDAAEQQFNNRQAELGARFTAIRSNLSGYDRLTLRALEREAVQKEVICWILGPGFDFIPQELEGFYGASAEVTGVIDSAAPTASDPESVSLGGAYEIDRSKAGASVLTFGDHVRFLQDAFEWENMLFMPYPYFWDTKQNWAYKRDFNHTDYMHRNFLRAGSLRVVVPVRPNFEHAFLAFHDNGDLLNNSGGTKPTLSIVDAIIAQNEYLSAYTVDGEGGIATEGGVVVARWQEWTPTNSLDIDVVHSKAIQT